MKLLWLLLRSFFSFLLASSTITVIMTTTTLIDSIPLARGFTLNKRGRTTTMVLPKKQNNDALLVGTTRFSSISCSRWSGTAKKEKEKEEEEIIVTSSSGGSSNDNSNNNSNNYHHNRVGGNEKCPQQPRRLFLSSTASTAAAALMVGVWTTIPAPSNSMSSNIGTATAPDDDALSEEEMLREKMLNVKGIRIQVVGDDTIIRTTRTAMSYQNNPILFLKKIRLQSMSKSYRKLLIKAAKRAKRSDIDTTPSSTFIKTIRSVCNIFSILF